MENNSSSSNSGKIKRVDVDDKFGRKEVGFIDIKAEYERYECLIEPGIDNNVPSWLNGNFYKQAGAAFVGEGAFLDGLAGISAFHINGKDGKFYYSNKILDQIFSREYIRSNGQVRKWEGTAASTKESDKPGLITSFQNSLMSFLYRFSDTKLYRSANPNVVVWRLSDADHTHGKDPKSYFPAAATEAEGNVLRFDKNTLEKFNSENIYAIKWTSNYKCCSLL